MNKVMQESSNEEQIAYQKEFLSVLGHEFKTPLNPIIGYAEVLLEKFKEDPEAKELLLKIRDSGSDLLSKIESILEYNFLCTRQSILNPRAVNFDELLNEFYESAKIKCNDAGLQFLPMSNFDECGVLKILIDKSRLIQVLTLLLDNAKKFTQEGKIILRGMAEVDLKNNYVNIKLGLTDQGCGVETYDRESIYLPMSQGSNNFCRSSKGTGMGLAIAKKIILSFPEGKIGHHSSSKKGTCFWLSFRSDII